MKEICYAMVCTLAFIFGLAADVAAGPDQQTTNTVASPYNGLVGNNQQGSRFGWVPNVEATNDSREIRRKYTRKERRERESLRRAYDGQFETGIRVKSTDPYDSLSEEMVQASLNRFPEIIENSGDADKNFCVMITASWCVPCKRMYKVIKELRKEGYIFYVFDIDSKVFKNFDAKFDVRRVPTFIIYNEGKEIKRTIGTTKADWFRKQLKTREEQKPKPKPVVDPVDEDPYDEI